MKKIFLFAIFAFFILLFFENSNPSLAQTSPSLIGQCQSTNLIGSQIDDTGINVTWGYPTIFWANVEQTPGNFTWNSLDNVIRNTPSGKKIWIQVSTSNPGVRTIPSWASDVSQIGNPYWDSTQDGSKPVQWDPDYKRYLRRLVSAMAVRYDNDAGGNAKIEAVLIMAGGNYGEMSQTVRCCHGAHEYSPATCPTRESEEVHNQNTIFIQTMAQAYGERNPAVLTEPYHDPEASVDYVAKFDYYYVKNTMELIDIYAQAFTHKKVVVQLGSGVSCQFIVAQEVMRKSYEKYCNHVWFKQNGWGSRPVTGEGKYLYYEEFEKYKDKTRTILEAGILNPWRDAAHNTEHVNAAIDYKISAVCFQSTILVSPTPYPIPYQTLKNGLESNYNNWYSRTPTCGPQPTTTITPTPTLTSTPTPSPTQRPLTPTPTFTPAPSRTPTPTPYCNRLGEATIEKFNLWKSEFNNPSVNPATSQANFNCDEKVNLEDFEIWRENRNSRDGP